MYSLILTREAGGGIKPGVKRSGTPDNDGLEIGARLACESAPHATAVAHSAGSRLYLLTILGFRFAVNHQDILYSLLSGHPLQFGVKTGLRN